MSSGRHAASSGTTDRRRVERGLLLARVLGGLGRTMITSGVLILLFVAYQLWGTGVRTAQAQNRLERQLEEYLAEGQVVGGDGSTATTTGTGGTTATTAGPGTTGTTGTTIVPSGPAEALPPELLPREGEPVGRIQIPRIGVDWVYVAGVGVNDLKEGPGHYPETPLPGQPGNSAIAGHRTTYGAPFANIDQLQPGDQITVSTIQGEFTYEVRQTVIVSPAAVEVLEPNHWGFANSLTLTACHPRYSAAQRIVVAAELIGRPAPASALTETVFEGGDDDPVGDDGDAPTLDATLSGDRAGAAPAVAWGAACAAVWLAAWGVGRWRQRLKWPAYAVGILPFLVLLFLFFENFSRLLPANY